MIRFLSNSFYNYFLYIPIVFIFICFPSLSFTETKPLDGLNKLHSSLEKITRKKINDSSFKQVLSITKEIYDVKKMSRMIIGDEWKKVSSNDKKEFIQVFEKFIVVNYFRRFSKLNELRFIHKETKVIGNKFLLVRFQLRIDEDIVKLDYLLHDKSKKWQIFDVLLDGSISEIATKKSDFKKIINDKGIKGLISDLKLRNKL